MTFNQKLGKPAILYDKLEMKHTCMTFDIHRASDDRIRYTAHHGAYRQSAVRCRLWKHVGSAAGACPGMERFAVAFAGKSLTVKTASKTHCSKRTTSSVLCTAHRLLRETPSIRCDRATPWGLALTPPPGVSAQLFASLHCSGLLSSTWC